MTNPEQHSIVGLTHDIIRQRSFALLAWDDVADKRLSVPVPYNIKLHDLLPAVQAVLVEFRTELESADLKIAAPPKT